MTAAQTTDGPIVLFDGVCNLCNGSVQFILDRDPSERIRFAALQSDAARRLLATLGHPLPAGDPDSVLLVEGARVWQRSDAALRIARLLRTPWWLLGTLTWVPRVLRDGVYGWIARHRYRWFGRTEACRVPTSALRERFLA